MSEARYPFLQDSTILESSGVKESMERDWMICIGTFAKFATSAASKRPADAENEVGRHFSGL